MMALFAKQFISPDEEALLDGLANTTSQVVHAAMVDEAQRQSEERYRELVENSNDIVFQIDTEGFFTFVNRATSRISGYPEEELIGLHFTDLILPDYREETQKFYGRQLVKKIPSTYYEFPFKTKNGEVKWVGQNVQSITREDEIVGFQSIARDITERKETEKALQESEERHRNLVEHLPQRIFVKDRNSVYVSCNAKYAADLGIVPEQIAGQDDFAFFPPELAQVYRADDQACMASGTVKDLEEPYRLAENERWVHTIKVPYRDEQGQVIGVLGIFEDITDHKKAEAALRESEERFRAFFEATFESIFLTHKGVCIDQNLAAERMFGYSTEEVLGKLGTEAISPEYRDLVLNNILSGYAEPYEAVALRKDGTTFPSEIQGRMFNHQGRQIRVTAIRDISKRKAAEEALRESEERHRILVETVPSGIGEIDPFGTITFANEAYCSLYGYSMEEMIGKSILDLQASEATAKQLGDYLAFVKRERPPRAPWFSEERARDGKRINVQVDWNYKLDDEGGVVGFIFVISDITEQRRAERALQESEERFRSLIEEASDAIFVHDFNGKFLQCNRQACASLGYTRDELLLMSVSDIDPDAVPRGDSTKFWAASSCNLRSKTQTKRRGNLPCGGTTRCHSIWRDEGSVGNGT